MTARCSPSYIISWTDSRLHVAHVGDSSAVLSGSCLTPTTAVAAEIPLEGDGSVAAAIDLCYDHSPEALAEFRRVRAFRPSTSRPGFSEVNFVYDSLSFNKAACPDIFAITGTPLSAEENLTVTNTGKYYKNVRSEWASLVCTPSHAAHQDALAFTRSLGDFHLQTYGVSHAPEVRPPIDLAQACAGPAVLIVATDGIWDNWKLQDCIGELLKPEVRVPFLPSLLRFFASPRARRICGTNCGMRRRP